MRKTGCSTFGHVGICSLCGTKSKCRAGDVGYVQLDGPDGCDALFKGIAFDLVIRLECPRIAGRLQRGLLVDS